MVVGAQSAQSSSEAGCEVGGGVIVKTSLCSRVCVVGSCVPGGVGSEYSRRRQPKDYWTFYLFSILKIRGMSN